VVAAVVGIDYRLYGLIVVVAAVVGIE
jgi:hypothetical protein